MNDLANNLDSIKSERAATTGKSAAVLPFLLDKFLSFLRAKARVAGLEISDTALRFVYFKDGLPEAISLRLPPGIIENGEIKNPGDFVDALKELRQRIPSEFVGGPLSSRKNPVNVVVTLSSVRIYIQVFSLPLVKEENLEEAIQLNIRMISPVDLSQAYAGWQLVNQNQNELRIEILTAFASKSFIDQLSAFLKEGGFSPLAIESGALSLTRLVREKGAGFERNKFYLILNIDNQGLQFLIIKRGQLNFEYFTSWEDIRGEAKEISWRDFEAAIKKNLHQVLNFYSSHWSEPLTDIFFVTPSFVEEIEKIIRENFSLNVNQLKLRFGEPVPKEWFGAIGAALRGELSRFQDHDINLLGIPVQEEFRRQEIIYFLRFWELLIPASLGLLLVAFSLAYYFTANLSRSLESQAAFLTVGEQVKEINSLQSQINDFNQSVSLIASLQNSLKPKMTILNKIDSLVVAKGLILDRLYLQPGGLPAVLSGEAPSQDQILDFKNSLAADQAFQNINLPLADIQPRGDGFSFTINFTLK